jgi:shikimate dehydrogenase
MSTPKCFVLLGHPVGHSVSPAIHGAAYRALGVQHRYDVVDCPTEADVHAQVQRLRRGEIAGANVTVPWKRLALSLADRADDSAQSTGVANVLSRDVAGHVTASNTDAAALAEEIAALHPAPESAAVIGAGGAAQAAVVACKMLGLSAVAVSNRGWIAGQPPSEWKRAAALSSLGAVPWAWPESPSDRRPEVLASLLSRVDVIIQATSAGMRGAAPGQAVSDWIPWRDLKPGAVALDVVYNPPLTPFLQAAAQAGVRHTGGLGMLVRQAALAIKIWLDVPSDGQTDRREAWRSLDLGALHTAAERALSAQAAAAASEQRPR